MAGKKKDKDVINKTLSVRIIRPRYSDDIEKEISDEKAKRKQDGKTGELDRAFFSELKSRNPDIITNDELFPLFTEIQKNLTEIYNKSISLLYMKLIVEEEGGSTASALSAGPYKECKARFNSYISLGLRQKIQSNFRRKELKGFQVSLPTAKSDRFPIPFCHQVENGKGGFKVYETGDDFIFEVPLIKYTATNKKSTSGKNYTKVQLNNPPVPMNVPLLLSTMRRRQTKKGMQWNKDEGTNAELRRVMSGEYKVSYAEIIRRTRFGKHDDWFVNFSIKFKNKTDELNQNVRGGIDIGVSNPLVCAVTNGLDRYIVANNDIMAFNERAMARRRTLLRKNRFKRSGHGAKNKLEPITVLTEKNERFRKSILQRWAREVAEFFKRTSASVVNMEDLSGITEREDFFSTKLRTTWNYRLMQTTIENKLKEYGIAVNYISPKYTSQTCHSCGKRNDYFTFSYRSENNYPPFECKECNKVKCNADFNAAKNIALKVVL